MVPRKKGLAVGMVLIGFGLSPLVTAPLARILVDAIGVKNTFLTMGIIFGILISILSYPFKYPNEWSQFNYKTDKSIKNSYNEIDTLDMIKSKSFIGLYLNFIIGTMIGLMLIGMTSNIAIELIRITSREVSMLMAVFAIFNGIGRPTFGWLTDKLSSKKAMLISYGLIAVSALLMLIAKEGNVLIYTISFSVFWFNLGGWLTIAPTSTLELYGTKNYSKNYGVVFTAYGIGAITGVVTSGMLIDIHNNYHYIFYYVLALCGLGILLTTKPIMGK